MVREKAHVFVGGPPLVKSAFGEEMTKEELGGYRLHTRLTGVVDNDAVDEAGRPESGPAISIVPSFPRLGNAGATAWGGG